MISPQLHDVIFCVLSKPIRRAYEIENCPKCDESAWKRFIFNPHFFIDIGKHKQQRGHRHILAYL